MNVMVVSCRLLSPCTYPSISELYVGQYHHLWIVFARCCIDCPLHDIPYQRVEVFLCSGTLRCLQMMYTRFVSVY